jgi:helix-turn-helix protein
MPSKQQARVVRRKRLAGYSTESETAEELNVAVRTLRKWRAAGEGPPWTTVGRQIFYGDESSAAWLKSQEVRPVRAA